MTKRELLKFIKEHKTQLERFAGAQSSGRLTREEQKQYQAAYHYVNSTATLCFTCGRSAQIMGKTLLRWAEDNKPKKKK